MDTPTTVAFQGAMTLHSCEAVRERLLAALDESDTVEIDCGAVEEVDVTFVVLMLAALTSASAAGKTIRLAPPASGALLDTLRRGGFVGDPAGSRTEAAFWGTERS